MRESENMKNEPTEVAMNDEDLWDAIVGSGAGSYPWYTRWVIVDPTHNTEALDVLIDCEDVRESATLTPGTIRRAIESLVDGDYNIQIVNDIDWSDPDGDTMIDADVADCIIQYAVLGDVVFG
jgi:hypothetical protein